MLLNFLQSESDLGIHLEDFIDQELQRLRHLVINLRRDTDSSRANSGKNFCLVFAVKREDSTDHTK